MSDYSPFFDQEPPNIEVDGMIASADRSPSWELDAQAVFKAGHRFLVVEVYVQSAWCRLGWSISTQKRTSRKEVEGENLVHGRSSKTRTGINQRGVQVLVGQLGRVRAGR